MSEIVNRPPGLATRNISLKTFRLSGARLITQLEMIRSTVPSITGIASAIPLRNSTLEAAYPRLVATMGILSSDGQHRVSHVDSDDMSGRSDEPGGFKT